MAIIAGINLIPVFVVNNVDYSTHLGKHRSMQVE